MILFRSWCICNASVSHINLSPCDFSMHFLMPFHERKAPVLYIKIYIPCPERLWGFPCWRYSGTMQSQSCAMCSRLTLPEQGRWARYPLWSPPTLPILWFWQTTFIRFLRREKVSLEQGKVWEEVGNMKRLQILWVSCTLPSASLLECCFSTKSAHSKGNCCYCY